MSNIFTYGSLMFDEVWSRLITTKYRKTTAMLSGYTRKSVINEEYPVIFKGAPDENVEGIIYFDISPDDMERLDSFEGDYYSRRQEQVQRADGSLENTYVYVLKDKYRHIASTEDWDFTYFAQQGVRSFLHNYSGFRL